MSALQRIAVIQLVEGKPVAEGDEELRGYAESMSPEDVQLYYEIAMHGLRDLNISRDRRMGFEMTLLRMLAFRPEQTAGRPGAAGDTQRGKAGAPARPAAAAAASQKSAARAERRGPPTPSSDAVALAAQDAAPAGNGHGQDRESPFANWPALLAAADVRGMARQLADHCEVESFSVSGRRLSLVLARGKEHLETEQLHARLEERLSAYLGYALKIAIASGDPPRPTPAELRLAGENERMRAARESIEQDANIQAVQAAFDAVVEADSIQPIEK